MLKVNFPLIALVLLVTSDIYAWDRVSRDETLQFDIINVLRCLDADSPVDFRIGSTAEGTLSVHVNYTEVNEREAQAIFKNCYGKYGNERIISLEMFANEDPLEEYYGRTSELLDGHEAFSSVRYYKRITQNSQKNDMFLPFNQHD